MTGSSTASCAWMLLLTLLPFFIFSLPVHNNPVYTEMNMDLEELKKCSNAPNKLLCLNITEPQSECPFPYFIAGIDCLNCNNGHVNNLRYGLYQMNEKCQARRCDLNVTYESLISPQKFYEKLKTLIENNNDKECYDLS